MNDERLHAILTDALAALDAGASVEQILSRYPAEADRLRPVLVAAVRLNTAGRATRDTLPKRQALARHSFLARAAARSPSARPASRPSGLFRIVAACLAIAMLAIVISGGVLSASAASLPGDPFYPVKRSVENLQLSLTFDPARRVNLDETFRQRRMEEVRAVQTTKRAETVEFVSYVQLISPPLWFIGGVAVGVTPDTVIEGAPKVGDPVKVIGRTLPDGQVAADRILAEGIVLSGAVESMRGSVWTIKGQRVFVTSETSIVGAARVGAQVQGQARRLADSTLLALKLEFDDFNPPGPGPLTATLRPSMTITSEPTARVEPSATPRPPKPSEPTETPRPHPTEPTRAPETEAPRRTPDATRVRESSRTPEPGHTPEPTLTREPERTPESTETRRPSRTPELTRTPQTPPTNQPTRTPGPQHTPEPTETRRSTLEPEPTRTREPPETPKP